MINEMEGLNSSPASATLDTTVNLDMLTFFNLVMILTLWIRKTNALLEFQSIHVGMKNRSSGEFKHQELYVTKGDDVKIKCLHSFLTEEISSKILCTKIFWQWNKKPFRNSNKSLATRECLSILHIKNVWWEGKQTFFCIYIGYVNNREVIESKSLSINSGEKPKHVPHPLIQWIEDLVEITWTPSADNDSYDTLTETRYTVEYFVAPESTDDKKTILPSVCGIFPLINCSDHIKYYCKASFSARLMTSYNIKLVAENKYGRMPGKTLQVIIPLYQQKMFVKPVRYLRVYMTTSGIELRWRSTDDFFAVERNKISYKCQGSSINHTNFTFIDNFAIPKDKLPIYTFCSFCVSIQRYEGGRFSCKRCTVIRTPEGVPNGIPELNSCLNASSCPITRFSTFKNVTISWRLPNKRSCNGIIIQQLIFYSQENERMLQKITINHGNITKWTLANLKIGGGYRVFMIICTNAGCGKKSKDIYIPRILESSVSSESWFFSDRANTGLVVGVTFAILFLCFVLIFMVLFVKSRDENMLPPLCEPQIATEKDIESAEQSLAQEVEYDLLEYRNTSEL